MQQDYSTTEKNRLEIQSEKIFFIHRILYKKGYLNHLHNLSLAGVTSVVLITHTHTHTLCNKFYFKCAPCEAPCTFFTSSCCTSLWWIQKPKVSCTCTGDFSILCVCSTPARGCGCVSPLLPPSLAGGREYSLNNQVAVLGGCCLHDHWLQHPVHVCAASLVGLCSSSPGLPVRPPLMSLVTMALAVCGWLYVCDHAQLCMWLCWLCELVVWSSKHWGPL